MIVTACLIAIFYRLRTFLLILLACASPALAEQAALSRALETIRIDDLKGHVAVLADDTFEGREAGSRGGIAAGHYLREKLEKYELKPAGDSGTFFQIFSNGYRNILGLLEGSDPTLKNEVIVVGAHYDHVGYGSQKNSFGPFGYVHNGADDNASGISVVLEFLEALRSMPEPPKRSILIAFWDAEEKGLLGSEHWLNHPTIELSRIKSAVNIDMVGRLTKERLEIFGSRTAEGTRSLLSEQNREGTLRLAFDWKMAEDSDHWSFFRKRIPVVMLHTGLHGDYHRPSDDAHTLNNEGMRSISVLLTRYVHALADQESLGSFRTASTTENETSRKAMEMPLQTPRPRLGMSWKKREAGGVIVTQLTAGTPSARVDLRAGDIVTHCDGSPINDEAAFRRRILLAQSNVKFTLERAGITTPIEIDIPLDGSPIRWGLSWRSDPGEPGVYVVTNVIYGSPAAEAGLRAGDRLDRIGGIEHRDADHFAASIREADTTLEFRMEREGRLSHIRLEPLRIEKEASSS